MDKGTVRDILRSIGPILGKGVIEVAVERMNQKNKGYTESHDKTEHPRGELVEAAVAYALKAVQKEREEDDATLINEPIPEEFYPWDDESKLDQQPIELLKKAGALIAAEIDRRESSKEYTDEDRDLEDGGPPETQI